MTTYTVKLECRTGGMNFVSNAWEYRYHTITFLTTDNRAEAESICESQLIYNPREVRRAWIEERETPCGECKGYGNVTLHDERGSYIAECEKCGGRRTR